MDKGLWKVVARLKEKDFYMTNRVVFHQVVEGLWRVGIIGEGGMTFHKFEDAKHAYDLLKAQEKHGGARLDSIRNISSVI